jgi:uncharacterized DUF497 family protein
MKYFDWDGEKNEWLIENRGISFEMCIVAINQGDILSQEPNKMPYSHQKRYILNINNYVYVVPYVEDDEKIFLKTIYPSRKLKKKYSLT